MKKLFAYLIFLFVSFCIYTDAQEFTPIVTQFAKKEYNASSQNWDVKQAADGVMYFGNNSGLLRFDGSDWKTYKIPGNKIVRSIYIAPDNKIYVGAFEEFGYFEQNSQGELTYISLSEKLNNYKMINDEIWNIFEYKGSIIFQSFTSFFTYAKSKVTGKRYSLIFLFFQKFDGKIYTHTEQKGFCYYDDTTNDFIPVPNCPFKSTVISLLPVSKKGSLIVTKSDGIFEFDGINFRKFQTNAENELTRAIINKAVFTKDSLLVIGTIQNGVTAINRAGRKEWNLNTSNVLQNNTVLGMFTDSEKNLWLALDKGISVLYLGFSAKYINSFSPSIGAIYAVNLKAPDNLFIGTNQGFYRAKLNLQNKTIEKMSLDNNIKGQVWDISKFDNQYFCGNNEQTYQIDENGSKIVSSVKGGFCMTKGIIHGKEILVQGTYAELCIYEKKNNEWTFSHTVKNFLNPIQYIQIDYEGTIWAAHMHEGLFSIRLNEDLRTIDEIKTYDMLDGKNKLPIRIFSLNNRIVFTDGRAFYTYNDLNKKIEPFDHINKSVGIFSQSYRVYPFHANMYWFIRQSEAALIELKGNVINKLDRIQYSLFQNQIVDEYQSIFPVTDKFSLITLENSLVLYNVERKNKQVQLPALQLSRIEVWDKKNRKNILLPIQSGSKPKMDYKNNSVRFTVFFPMYSYLNDLVFKYRLKGKDDVWSDAIATNKKEYNYLSPGKYTFEVQALTQGGKLLSSTTYEFVIKPPFYWNTFTKILYTLLLLGVVYLIYLLIKKTFRIKKEKIKSEAEKIRIKEVEKREQQIIALKNEKLETELVLKSKELASSTMTIIKKNELLNTIKEEIVNLKKTLGSQYPNKYYDKLMRLLDENISSEADWGIFQTNFDRIHENFFRNLHTKYPDLTSNDLKFCAYLRLNLSTKDIAHLLNITPKGVEVGRYRIRKKIGLPSEKSLSEFLIEFK